MLRRRRRTLLLTLLVLAVGIGVLVAVLPSDEVPRPPTITSGITAMSGTRELSDAFSGFSMSGSGGAMTEPGFAPALKQLAPQSLRGYPGGVGSNYTNWHTGQAFTTSSTGLDYIGPGLPERPQQLSLFTAAAKAAHATPVFTLNVMTYCPLHESDPVSTDQAAPTCSRAEACGPDPAAYTAMCTNTDPTWGLPYQLRMLETAKRQGVPIKYVELGNELYSADAAYYFPTVESYIAKANVWIAAIRTAFPGVKIGVVGFSATDCVRAPNIQASVQARQASWNSAVVKGIRDEDALVFHTYFESGISSPGDVTDARDAAQMLSGAAQSCISHVRARALSVLPNGLHAWVTEWNLYPTEGVVEYGSWAQGLTEALYAVELTRQPQITLIDNEMLISSQVFGAILGGATSTSAGNRVVRLPNGGLPTVEPFALSGGGQALSAFNHSAHGATTSAALSFSTMPKVNGTRAAGLYGQAFSSGASHNLFLVNLSGKDVVLGLGSLAGHYTYDTRHTDPGTFVLRSDSIDSATGTATDRVVLPAYSVTSLTSS